MFKRKKFLSSFSGAVITAAMMGYGATAHAEFPRMKVYDDFESSVLNKNQWVGGIVHSSVNELRRQLARGRLITGLRGFSDRDDDSREKARNSLFIPEDMAAGVTSLNFRASVNRARVSRCVGSTSNRVKLRTGGYFFNRYGTSVCGDRTGDIFAQVWIGRIERSNLSKHYFNVSGGVKECLNATCSEEKSHYYQPFGIIKKNKLANLGVHWDSAGNRFIFKSEKKSYVYDYSDDLANMGPPSGDYAKGIQSTADIEQCLRRDGKEPYGLIYGSVDLIKVNRDYVEQAQVAPAHCK